MTFLFENRKWLNSVMGLSLEYVFYGQKAFNVCTSWRDSFSKNVALNI